MLSLESDLVNAARYQCPVFGTAIAFSTSPRVVEVAEDRFRFLAGGLKVDARDLRLTYGRFYRWWPFPFLMLTKPCTRGSG